MSNDIKKSAFDILGIKVSRESKANKVLASAKVEATVVDMFDGSATLDGKAYNSISIELDAQIPYIDADGNVEIPYVQEQIYYTNASGTEILPTWLSGVSIP